jgi:hypothetical protein
LRVVDAARGFAHIGGRLTELSDEELLEALQAVKELRARRIEAEATGELVLITESKHTNGDGNPR